MFMCPDKLLASMGKIDPVLEKYMQFLHKRVFFYLKDAQCFKHMQNFLFIFRGTKFSFEASRNLDFFETFFGDNFFNLLQIG